MSLELYNGDCLAVLDELIASGQTVDFCFTSPPYNRKRNDKYNNYDDTKMDYFEFLCEVTDKNLAIGRYFFLNIQKSFYNKVDVFRFIGKYADKIIDMICWGKTNPMPASGYKLTNAYEYILVISNTETAIQTSKTYIKNLVMTSVYSNNPYRKIHRAVMNPELSDWFVDSFTKEGDTVLDCFMGLGTTGISCCQKGRNFIGIELDETYFRIAKERIENSDSQMTIAMP